MSKNSINCKRIKLPVTRQVFCLLLTAVFALTFSGALGSGRQTVVKGTVTDEAGAPLPGASVTVKGAQLGASTDENGAFTLEVPDPNAVLIITSIGFATQEVPVNSRSTIQITLVPDQQQLEEVVVVGYGSQLKREVTGAVQTLSSEDIKDIPVPQVTQKLQGKVAGVQINQTTGIPGRGMSVRIRGQMSVSAGSDPLYVVDGFPITGGINSLNPDEIADISILKDAASTSLYGSRAANGVVLITTKKNGTPGQTNVSFNAYTGWQKVPQRGRIEMMNAEEFAQFKKEIYEDVGRPVPEAFQNPAQYRDMNDNNWYDALLRTAPIQSYNLSMVQTRENSNTSVTAGIFDQQGVVLNTDYRRYSLRMNNDFTISDKVKMGFNIAPQYVEDNIPRTDGDRGTGILFNALHTWPIMPIYGEDGEPTLSNQFPASTGNIYVYPNWVRAAKELVNETKEVNVLSNAYIQYEPLDGLVLKSTFNVDFSNHKFFFFNPSTATSGMNVPIPTTAVSTRMNFEERSWLNENLATYTRSFNDHNFELLAGFTNQTYERDLTRLQADTYSDDRLPTVQGALNINRGGTNNQADKWSLTSIVSRLTYNYKGKYLFTAAFRSDGSSRFGSENRWGTFPSVSAGWILSDEDFFTMDKISFAKLRGSFGVIGNNNIGNYTQHALINNTVNAVFGDVVAPGAAISSLANSGLGWETTRQFDAGLDLGLFNDRVQLIYDFYTKRTTNLLYSVQVAQESGFGNYNDNIGEIKFWGHELALSTRNLEGKFSWTTNANISFNRNKVMELAEGIDRVYGTFHITQVGQPFGQFYGLVADGVYMNEADLESSPQIPGRSVVGSIKIKDVNGDGTISYGGDFDDRTIIGSPFPKFTYGITNNFRYQNFDLSIVGSGSFGNQLLVRHIYSTANLDGVFNVLRDVKYRFRSEENPGRGFYGITAGADGNITGVERDWMNSRFIADASFFAIKNITLGYTFDQVDRFFRSARIYASVQQAFVFTNYWGGPNPETSAEGDGDGDGGNLSQGVDLSSYPVPRTFTFGVNFNF